MITQEFLDAGFESYRCALNVGHKEGNRISKIYGFGLHKEAINPNDNWFGASVYHPDWVLIRGEKSMILSVNGVLMPLPETINEGLKKILKSLSARYMCFKENGEIKYETYTGQLPDREFINDFLK